MKIKTMLVKERIKWLQLNKEKEMGLERNPEEHLV